MPEIQYLAYLHNAEDQLRGEAATLQFFSQGQYRNRMVVRIAGYGYQKGFGGHFHNDDVGRRAPRHPRPRGRLARPGRTTRRAMLRTCVAAAKVDGSVCVFLEPIALYHTRDLHEQGDGLAGSRPPTAASHVPIGSARTYGDGRDLTIVTCGNGLYLMSLRVARRLAAAGLDARVVDLRWLAPLPVEDIPREAVATSGCSSSTRPGARAASARASSRRWSTPASTAARARRRARTRSSRSATPPTLVLLSEDEIEAAALDLV